MQSGVGASIKGALQGMPAMRNVAGLATSPDQMLVRVAEHAALGTSPVSGVHFYSFGGALATARWLRAVAEGRFELGPAGNGFSIRS